MKKIDISILILFIYFSLDIIGIPKFVDYAGILSADMFWWIIFLILMIGYVIKWKRTDIFMLIYIILWNILTFIDHWRYVFFGVSQKKLIGYNRFFQDTHHIIPPSTTRLVPDTYHIILSILLIINLIYMIRKVYLKILLKNDEKISYYA